MPCPTDLLEPILERPGDREPDIGILMPIYNTESLVGTAVASVLGQQNCVADILISDDQSPDGTLAAALRTVEAWRGPHRVRVFRTARRLAIDHLGTLVAASAQPFLMQAHGDDESRPIRAATLRDIHRQTGAALVSSLAIRVDGKGAVQEAVPQGFAAGWVTPAALARGSPIMLSGARLALDRRIYDAFPPLTSSYLSLGHDTLQSWRALLLGGVWLSDEPLLRVRRHDGQWSHRLWDTRTPEGTIFAYNLHRLAVLRAARRDIAHVETAGTVDFDRLAEVRRQCREAWNQAVEALLDARETQRRKGLEPFWIGIEDMATLKRESAAAASLLTPPDRRL